MSSEFRLTNGPIRVTAPIKQPLTNAIDLGAYRELNVLLTAFEVVGGGSATIRILSSWQNVTEDGWPVVVTFTAVTGSAPPPELKQVLAFLRYVRWEVSALTGASPAVTFSIDGIAKGE